MPDSEHTTDIPSSGTQQSAIDNSTSELSPQAVQAPQEQSQGRKKRRAKRMKLCDAMRACGLDEHAVAGMYKRVLRSLHESEPKLGAKVQFLKECARILETKHTSRGSRNRNEFRAVKLIHKVPRPVRGETPPKATSQC